MHYRRACPGAPVGLGELEIRWIADHRVKHRFTRSKEARFESLGVSHQEVVQFDPIAQANSPRCKPALEVQKCGFKRRAERLVDLMANEVG